MAHGEHSRVAIYGCGGFGREVLPIVKLSCRDVIFVSDLPEEIGISINGTGVISFDTLCSSAHRDRSVCIAIGSGHARKVIAERCEKAGLLFASIVAPTHCRYDNVSIGPGSIFCHQTQATSNISIGRHFQCNIYSYVAHDCVIGDFVTFAPRVSCNGYVVVENDVYIGTGALIKPGTRTRPLRIGAGAVIGMGAVVTKDVPSNAVVIGNPARVVEGTPPH